MSDTSITSAPAAPTADERLAAVDLQVGRYFGAKDCHIVGSADNDYLRSM